MVAATREKAKTRAQNSHMKTRRNFDEAEKKLANRATMLLHKEKMIQNMKFNDWKATDVASFYKKNGVTITRQTIHRWKQGDRTNARWGRPCIVDDEGINFIKKKVHEHNNTSLTCTFKTFREYCDAAALQTAARLRPDEGIPSFDIQHNFIAFMHFTCIQIVLKRNHLYMRRMRNFSLVAICCQRMCPSLKQSHERTQKTAWQRFFARQQVLR
jgi:hypothetical protein